MKPLEIHVNLQSRTQWTKFQHANAGCSLLFPMADRPEDAQLNGGRAALEGKWKNKDLCRICLELLT